jgi:uncharacterized protein (DUF1015 family)
VICEGEVPVVGEDMVDIRPFRGIRYNREAIGDLSLVVAPPYDVIDEHDRDYYYNRHPYNVIRLILNRPKKSDKDAEQPYSRAAQFLEQWLAQRILIRDSVPGLYLYRQRYLMESEYKECTGLVARVRVEEFSDGGIRPHEDIMPKPLEDRMKLLDYTQTNLDLVQALYSDPAEKLKDPILDETEKFPLAQFQTADGVAHDLWSVTDEGFIKSITRFFGKKKLYIADGHHRYETALEYARRIRERGMDNGDDDPRNFLMMMIVEMENPGLTVLPVHRVVLSGGDVSTRDLLRDIERWFDVEEVEFQRGERSGQVFHMLRRLDAAGRDVNAFGLFVREPDRFYLLSLKPGLDITPNVGGESSVAYRNLDVTVLHKLIIENALGIPPHRETVEQNLVFTRDALEAMDMVGSGRGIAAFFLNPTKVEQVREIADHGEKMPQKSTYFYPKPCSGVVMNGITEW